jgi:3-oxo-5-alpha-steroid 4-dehydrogenase 1
MNWYTGDSLYDTVLTIGLASIIPIAITSLFFIAPYGRFASKKFGANLDPRWGWILMELPATISFVFFYLQGKNRFELVPLLFLAVWLIHYANRGFIFPLLMRFPKGKRQSFSITVVTSGWFVTSVHGYLNATYISHFADYQTSWLSDPRFLAGIVIYYGALVGNIHADSILRNLRSKEEVAAGNAPYRIPHGGLYRYLTNPSYFYELLAWIGFALATYSAGALFVLGISAANLIPRAFATHRWYLDKFPDYPKGRKALVPFLV